MLKEIVDNILKDLDKPLSWLGLEMEMTYAGFRGSLLNESLKYGDLKKMAKILNVPISILFEGSTQKIKGNYNTQINSSIVGESEAIYGSKYENILNENLFLKQQIKDKEEIIKLLKNQQ
jgi:hypothetical protein